MRLPRVLCLVAAAVLTGGVLSLSAPAAAAEQESWLDATGDNGSGYDSRGDVEIMGLTYGDDLLTLGVDVVTPEAPTSYNWVHQNFTGIVWDLDVDMDGVRDFYARYVSGTSGPKVEVFSADGSLRICTGAPDYVAPSGYYFAHIHADCIGRPPALQTRALMGYQTDVSLSSDYVPSEGGWCCRVTLPVPQDPTAPPSGGGYWMLSSGGAVYNFGDAPSLGNAPSGAVDIEPTPQGDGYWVLRSTGGVDAFGSAEFLGGFPPLHPGEEAASLSVTTSGNGYWIFTSFGRVFAYGDAPHQGDMAGVQLNGRVLDSVATPSGQGYWMVASDGGIFSFGDSGFYGSMGGTPLNQPVMSMAPDPDGTGYWLVASDGGIFAFDAPFYGSMGNVPLNKPVSGMVPGTSGYLMVAEDGGIFAFGDVAFHGSLGSNPPGSPVVAVALLP